MKSENQLIVFFMYISGTIFLNLLKMPNNTPCEFLKFGLNLITENAELYPLWIFHFMTQLGKILDALWIIFQCLDPNLIQTYPLISWKCWTNSTRYDIFSLTFGPNNDEVLNLPLVIFFFYQNFINSDIKTWRMMPQIAV